MISEDNIKYSLRNLNHRKGRSLLTIFSILIGIATIFIFICFGYGLYDYTENVVSASSADKMMVMAKGGSGPGSTTPFGLNSDDLNAVQKAAGVYDATGMYYSSVQIEFSNEKKYVSLASYNPKKPLAMEMFSIGAYEGRMLQGTDLKKATLGYNYQIPGKIFEKGIGLNDVVKINDEKIKVIGFLEEIGNAQDDSQVYITNEYFEKLFPEKDSYIQIIARADISMLDKAVENVEKALRKERDLDKGKEDFFVQTFEDMMESYKAVINIIIGFIILIALISVLVSAINTANTMITSVLERYKEIGIMKAIGAKNSEVFSIFLFESAFLGFVAGTLGVLLGWGGAVIGGVILKSLGFGFLQPYFSIPLFVGCVAFAVITGAISGVIPAVRASKTNTVDALRYE